MEYYGESHVGALAELAVEALKVEAASYPGPDFYAAHLVSLYTGMGIFDYMKIYGVDVEPVGPSGEVDAKLPVANTFLKGVVLGMRVLEEYLGLERFFELKHCRFDVELPPPDYGGDFKAYRAERILGRGKESYEAASAYHELLAEWEEILSREVDDKEIVRSGFGFALSFIPELEMEISHDELKSEVDAFDSDWDQAFIKHFGQ